MNAAARWTSLGLLLAGTLALLSKMEFTWAGLFFVPLALWPLMVSAAASFFVRETRPATWIFVSAVLYALWFGFIYASVFYLNPDPQGAIAFVFVGFYALPVMLIFWVTAFVMELKQRQKAQFDTSIAEHQV